MTLSLQPLIEFSDEHCRSVRSHLAELFRNFGIPPVGKDGSGGVISDELVDGAYCGTRPKHNPA